MIWTRMSSTGSCILTLDSPVDCTIRGGLGHGLVGRSVSLGEDTEPFYSLCFLLVALSILFLPPCWLLPCPDELLSLWTHKLKQTLLRVALPWCFYYSNRKDASIRTDHSVDFYLLFALWQVLCLGVTLHPCKKKVLRWGSRDALSYRYDDKSLRIILILFPLSRTIVAGSPLGPEIHQALIMVPGVGLVFCGVGLKSKQKVIDYSQDIHATTVPVGTSYPASCYWGSQGS